MQTAIATKRRTASTFRPMPRSGLRWMRAAGGAASLSRDVPRPSPRPAVASSAASTGANISSISASVIVIGGQKPRVSPMARQITPRSISSCAARAPTLPGWAKPAFERSRRELEPAHQAEMPGLADQRVAGEPVEVGGEARGDGADARGHVLALVDLDRLDPDGAGDRVAAVGVAVAEGADPAAVGLDRLGHVSSIATAESGRKPAVSCLAIETEFGAKPSAWAPNHSPVRPKPQITSSEIGEHVVPARAPRRSPRSSPRAAR